MEIFEVGNWKNIFFLLGLRFGSQTCFFVNFVTPFQYLKGSPQSILVRVDEIEIRIPDDTNTFRKRIQSWGISKWRHRSTCLTSEKGKTELVGIGIQVKSACGHQKSNIAWKIWRSTGGPNIEEMFMLKNSASIQKAVEFSFPLFWIVSIRAF